MSPTPDERRATWIEPGLTRLRAESGETTAVAIDLERARAYQGNGIDVVHGGRIAVVLSAAAIRRMYRQLPPE
jgi:hypothetical protein